MARPRVIDETGLTQKEIERLAKRRETKLKSYYNTRAKTEPERIEQARIEAETARNTFLAKYPEWKYVKKELTEKQRNVLILLNDLNRKGYIDSYAKIGALNGCTRQNVEVLKKAAIAKLEKVIAEKRGNLKDR